METGDGPFASLHGNLWVRSDLLAVLSSSWTGVFTSQQPVYALPRICMEASLFQINGKVVAVRLCNKSWNAGLIVRI